MAAGKFSWGGAKNSDSSSEGSSSLFGKIAARSVSKPAQLAINAIGGTSKEALLLLQNYEESGRGWFWSTDAEGRITYLTDSVCELLGRTRDELFGAPLSGLFRQADEAEGHQRTLPFILRKQSKFDDLPLQAAKPGEDEIWWSVSGRPYFNGPNEFGGYRGSGRHHRRQSG